MADIDGRREESGRELSYIMPPSAYVMRRGRPWYFELFTLVSIDHNIMEKFSAFRVEYLAIGTL